MGNFDKRLEAPDPWEGFFRTRQSLEDAIAMVRRL
jgi:hypothetical protein